LRILAATVALLVPFASAANAQQVKVTIGKVIGGDGFHLPSYVALDQNFFEAEGLDATLVECLPGHDATTAPPLMSVGASRAANVRVSIECTPGISPRAANVGPAR